MPDRRDAFLAAAEIALAVEAAARCDRIAIDTVATVGVCDVFPGAVNSVPSRARLEVDVRDIDHGRRDCRARAHRRRVQRGCRAPSACRRSIEPLNADPPAQCAPASSRRSRGLRRTRAAPPADDQPRLSRLPVHVAHRADGMIFIPCRGGVSHRPDEYASPEAIAHGTAVLADTLARLSN